MQYISETLTEKPATRQRLRTMVDKYLQKFRDEAVLYDGVRWAPSRTSANLFLHYVGQTHSSLLVRWFGADKKVGGEGKNKDSTSRFTTCNGFVGTYFGNVIPSSKRKTASFHGFKYELICKKAGIELAYVSQKLHPDKRPGYGDIVRFTRNNGYHVAVCLGCAAGKWDRIESGQGGRGLTPEKSGDRMALRAGEQYVPSQIMSWVNLAILLDYDELAAEQQQNKRRWDESSNPWDSLMKANRHAHQNRS